MSGKPDTDIRLTGFVCITKLFLGVLMCERGNKCIKVSVSLSQNEQFAELLMPKPFSHSASKNLLTSKTSR